MRLADIEFFFNPSSEGSDDFAISANSPQHGLDEPASAQPATAAPVSQSPPAAMEVDQPFEPPPVQRTTAPVANPCSRDPPQRFGMSTPPRKPKQCRRESPEKSQAQRSPMRLAQDSASQLSAVEQQESSDAAQLLRHLHFSCSCGERSEACDGKKRLGKDPCLECGELGHKVSNCIWARGKGNESVAWFGKEAGKQLSKFLISKRVCVFCFAPSSHDQILLTHRGKDGHRSCGLEKRFARVVMEARSRSNPRLSHGSFLRAIHESPASFNKFCSEQGSALF